MTNFQTPQPWLGHNATRYHDLNALPHVQTRGNPLQIAQNEENLRENVW